MSLGELESAIFNSKDSPIKWIKLGKTQPTVTYNSLQNDGVDLVLDDNYLMRAEQLKDNQNFIDKLLNSELHKKCHNTIILVMNSSYIQVDFQ